MKSYTWSRIERVPWAPIVGVAILVLLAILAGSPWALMVAPIIIRNPIMTLTKLVDGTPTGAAIDVSDDVSKLELTPTIPTSNVQTFSGNYQTAGDPTWAAAATIVVNEDTQSNWAPIVGEQVRVKVQDRTDSPAFRTFDSEILFDPAIGGPTQPGQARSFDMALPVLSAVTWDDGVA